MSRIRGKIPCTNTIYTVITCAFCKEQGRISRIGWDRQEWSALMILAKYLRRYTIIERFCHVKVKLFCVVGEWSTFSCESALAPAPHLLTGRVVFILYLSLRGVCIIHVNVLNGCIKGWVDGCFGTVFRTLGGRSFFLLGLVVEIVSPNTYIFWLHT